MNLIFSIFFGALGAILGSFSGVIAERMHTGEKWANDRSRCNSCSRTLRAADLVPVLSWLFSKGRCRECKSKIPARYLAFEIFLAIAFVFSYQMFGLSLSLFVFLSALVTLAVIVWYDLLHMIVPSLFSLLFVGFSLLFASLRFSDTATLGMVFMQAAGIAFVIFLFYALSGGRAMGLGDTPVALGLALLAGGNAISGLVFSFWIGAVIGIFILFAHRKGTRMGIEVPFVPFLASGFLLAIFTGWNVSSLIAF
ncbi:MAG: prepilin peptidase [Minisyncoccia bacterium]